MLDDPDPFDLDALRRHDDAFWSQFRSPSDYATDRTWADGFGPEVERILRDLAGYLGNVVDIHAADDFADRQHCTDYVIEMTTGALAARFRRRNCRQRDFTIRYSRPGGCKVEYHKIMEGKGPRWYLYAWARDDQSFKAAVIVDVDRCRERRLFDNPHPIPNPDGTEFIAIPLWDLVQAGAVVWSLPTIIEIIRTAR